MPVIWPIEGGREIAMMQWVDPDLLRGWEARPEHVERACRGSAHFKQLSRAVKSRRCIVPATGSIEFTGPDGDKLAPLLARADRKPIALGGL